MGYRSYWANQCALVSAIYDFIPGSNCQFRTNSYRKFAMEFFTKGYLRLFSSNWPSCGKASCGRHRMAGIVWPASYGRHRVAGIAWQASRGRRRVAGVAWQASHGRHRMAGIAWQASRGRHRVADLLHCRGYSAPDLYMSL